MKKHFIMALAALGFAACNNSDLDDVNNAHPSEVETSYIAINLNAVDNSTRADDGTYQEGLEAERVVKSAYFFFFKENGDAFPVKANSGAATAPGAANDVNWISANLTNAGKEMNNVSDIKNAVLVLSTYQGEYPAQIVAVLNWAPQAGQAYSLANLYAATNINGTDNAFVMSNAVYSDGNNAIVGTPLTEGNIYKDETNALANPITIYVERIAAKVTVTAADVTDNRFKVNKDVTIGGSTKDVYVKVNGWALHNDFAQSTLLKIIDPTWNDDDLGFTWNDSPWHRCYWSTSLPFEEITENVFPSTFSLGMGTVSDVNNSIYTDNTYTYVGENTNYVLSDASKCTKVILKAQLQEKDGDDYKPLSLARWYATYYVGANDLLTAVANTIQYQYYWNDGNTYTKIAPEDLQVVKDGNLVKFQLSSLGEERSWFTKSGTGYEEKTKEEMNALLGGIEKAVYYESGETLYSVDIAHLGYQNEDKLGRYGVVRNHIYNVVINSFGGFGSPVYTPESNLEYPEDPTTEGDYVSAEVRILSWRLVSQEVNVQPQP